MDDRIRVVVADDQNISRGFFEMYVRAAIRYQLLAGLRSAKEAVAYVDEHETDLLILDIVMQNGMDGLTAAGEICCADLFPGDPRERILCFAAN